MNSQGGTLLIGVEDDGSTFGLDRDVSLVGGSRDKFEQSLINIIADEITPALSHHYRVRFDEVDEKQVCVVEVDPVSDGVFLKGEKGREFFISSGNTAARFVVAGLD